MAGGPLHVPVESPPGVVVAPTVPWSVVLRAGVVLAGLLALTAVLIVGRSVQRYRRRRRRAETRERLRSDLLERLYGPDDPDWTDWADSLSSGERSVLESLLEEYLRELDGSDARTLARLGYALGIDERSVRRLQTGTHFERLDALTWLALLRHSPDPSVLEKYCTDTPAERAGAARVLYASGHPEIASIGVDLLLGGRPEAFSVFGIDTLYRVAETDPSHLFERAQTDFGTWEPALQEQVLLAARHVSTAAGTSDLSWMVDSLSSPEERTRIEAARALGGYGWRRSLRDRIDLDAVCSDPSPKVRASVYRTLGEWGDEAAIGRLAAAAEAETDERARVAAAEALLERRDAHSIGVPESLTAAWTWAEEHAAFDRIATDVSGGGGR